MIKATKHNPPLTHADVRESQPMLPMWDEGGTTETDSKTDRKGSGGYSSINR